MQPTFLPWIGYFNLIKSCDSFVFLDDVQFEARSWQQRNRILAQGKELWLTVPTTRPNGQQTLIREVEINYEHFNPQNICETIRRSYGRKKGFPWLESELFPILKMGHPMLSDLNIQLIIKICVSLGLKTSFHRSSELETFGKREERLESILLNFPQASYLSPSGSKVYLTKVGSCFPSGTPIQYQQYVHPTYNQGEKEFLSHLSIIDLIASCGIGETKELI